MTLFAGRKITAVSFSRLHGCLYFYFVKLFFIVFFFFVFYWDIFWYISNHLNSINNSVLFGYLLTRIELSTYLLVIWYQIVLNNIFSFIRTFTLCIILADKKHIQSTPQIPVTYENTLDVHISFKNVNRLRKITKQFKYKSKIKVVFEWWFEIFVSFEWWFEIFVLL